MRRRIPLVASSVVGFGVAALWSVHAGAASFEGMSERLQGTSGIAYDVSADGSVLVGVTSDYVPFRWDPVRGAVPLERPALPYGFTPFAVSGDGSTPVGQGFDEDSLESYAARWEGTAGPTALPRLTLDPGADLSIAGDVSYDGSVVVGNSMGRAFRWDAEHGSVEIGPFGSVASGVSDDGSVVVGRFQGGSVHVGNFELTHVDQPFRWDAETGLVPLGWLPTDQVSVRIAGGPSARAISGNGEVIVGGTPSARDAYQAFRWDAVHGMVGLGDAPRPGDFSMANGVSVDGSIIVGRVGGSVFADFYQRRAVYWDSAGEEHALDVTLRMMGVNLDGWTLIEAYDVSADGRTIVGVGLNPDGVIEGWIAVIPEPGIGMLVGMGLMFLARRRRLSKSDPKARVDALSAGVASRRRIGGSCAMLDLPE